MMKWIKYYDEGSWQGHYCPYQKIMRKEIKAMTKNDFLNDMTCYIDSLRGTDLSGTELAEWIKKESNEFGLDLTEQQIEWIVAEVKA